MNRQLDLVQDGVYPWHVAHRNVQFPGEVVVASTWRSELGHALPRGCHFRVVFLKTAQAVRPEEVARGVVVAIPESTSPEEQAEVQRQLGVLREVQAGYQTTSDAGLRALGQVLGREEQQAAGRLRLLRGQSYARGTILSTPPVRLEPGRAFRGDDPARWADALAQSVVEVSLPAPRVETERLPRPVTPQDAPLIFDALVASHPEGAARQVLQELGAGLHLRPPELAGCPVLDYIQEQLTSQGGAVSVTALLDVLTSSLGLPRYLGALYVLALVARNRPASELALQKSHNIRTRKGDLFTGDRLGWDVLAEVGYPPDLEVQAERLTFPQPPSWRTVLPYALELVPNLRGPAAPSQQPEQEALVEQALRALRHEQGTLKASLALLQTVLASPTGSAAQEQLGLLERLVVQPDPYAFYQACARGGVSLGQLRMALAGFQRLKPLGLAANDLLEARSYLLAMRLGIQHAEMAQARTLLLARLDLHALEADPFAWPSARHAFSQLQDQYARAYRAHHQEYHTAAARLVRQLESATPLVRALALFNTLPELGSSIAPTLPARASELRERLRPCSERAEALPLDGQPLCRVCALGLDEAAPEQEVETLLADLERAWREQNRRLASIASRQVLAQRRTPAVDKLAKLVQTADLAPLANVLDEEVLAFLRSFAGAQPRG